MEITTRDYKRSNVIRVTGRVDASTYSQLEEKLNEYIENGQAHLVLEMDGTEYLSSAGVRVLISAQKALKPRGGRLALSQPSARVRDVLDLAGLEVLFPIYDTTVAALASE
ncbi:MAG: STAS domain-containing protein [Anaerolineales bacterium]|nr:STAS domain-containing protein [Anaerolineales bacterium]